MTKIPFRTDERNQLQGLIEQYGCSPFSGRCYTDEVSISKVGKTYHIILSEQQMEKFKIFEDFVYEDMTKRNHQFMIMIKPVSQDNNYIFFRRI